MPSLYVFQIAIPDVSYYIHEKLITIIVVIDKKIVYNLDVCSEVSLCVRGGIVFEYEYKGVS